MEGHKIPCPKCGQPLRHRVISNLRWCANQDCPDYHGVPPIKVDASKYAEMGKALRHAMSDEVWAEVDKEIEQGGEQNVV